jgi:hypothetical protein
MLPHVPVPDRYLEPEEPTYCEVCDNYGDDCECDVGYQEERIDD